MKIEYEATFVDIDKDKVRGQLEKVKAQLIRAEFLQKRVVFNLPTGHEITGGWLRVRDEGDKTTMSLKVVDGDKIENQKEILLVIDDFRAASDLLSTIGCRLKAYQESKREIWRLAEADITLDEWPFLEPFVEIEGTSEIAVRQISEKLGFDYNQALFCSVDTLYSKKYNLPTDVINNQTPEIKFAGPNPFIR